MSWGPDAGAAGQKRLALAVPNTDFVIVSLESAARGAMVVSTVQGWSLLVRSAGEAFVGEEGSSGPWNDEMRLMSGGIERPVPAMVYRQLSERGTRREHRGSEQRQALVCVS